MLVSTSTQLKCISVGSFVRTTGTPQVLDEMELGAAAAGLDLYPEDAVALIADRLRFGDAVELSVRDRIQVTSSASPSLLPPRPLSACR
jgi:hypothetical protein